MLCATTMPEGAKSYTDLIIVSYCFLKHCLPTPFKKIEHHLINCACRKFSHLIKYKCKDHIMSLFSGDYTKKLQDGVREFTIKMVVEGLV